MTNLKIGGILVIASAALFLLADTLLGDSELASYSMFFGLVMFPVGLMLVLVGAVQVVVAKIRDRSN